MVKIGILFEVHEVVHTVNSVLFSVENTRTELSPFSFTDVNPGLSFRGMNIE